MKLFSRHFFFYSTNYVTASRKKCRNKDGTCNMHRHSLGVQESLQRVKQIHKAGESSNVQRVLLNAVFKASPKVKTPAPLQTPLLLKGEGVTQATFKIATIGPKLAN